MRSFFCLCVLSASVLAVFSPERGYSDGIVDPASLMDGITGSTQYGAWNNLSAANVEATLVLDFPSHPGSGAWPGNVPNQLGAANSAVLTKVANAPGMPAKAPYFASVGPFAGTSSLGRMHYAGFTTTPNTNAGTLGVGSTTPLAGLTNLVFQVEIAEVFDYTFFNNALPTLNYNGGSQALAPTFSRLLSSTVGPVFQDEPVTINTWAVQWDLSAVGPITDFQVQFTGVEHSDVYGLRVDQYQNFSAIPEPGTVALGITGVVMLCGVAIRRRRRAA
jgi:hypothetical protein